MLVAVAVLLVSLSGRTLSHSDIGGYTEVDRQVLKHSLPLVTYLRDRELLQRWMELSAFSDVMFRTHPGLLPDASAQVWSTNASVAAFARMARVHVHQLGVSSPSEHPEASLMEAAEEHVEHPRAPRGDDGRCDRDEVRLKEELVHSCEHAWMTRTRRTDGGDG